MRNIKEYKKEFDLNFDVIAPSFNLIEAIRLYVFIERDLAALNREGPAQKPDLFVRDRRNLNTRIAQVSALIENDADLMAHPALEGEMVWLFDEVRASLSRHQENYARASAAVDIKGYRASAEQLQDSSKAFRNWCDIHLQH